VLLPAALCSCLHAWQLHVQQLCTALSRFCSSCSNSLQQIGHCLAMAQAMVQVWYCIEDRLECTGGGLESFGLQPCRKTLHSEGVLQAIGLQPWLTVQRHKLKALKEQRCRFAVCAALGSLAPLAALAVLQLAACTLCRHLGHCSMCVVMTAIPMWRHWS
jgi:hypothetical protein